MLSDNGRRSIKCLVKLLNKLSQFAGEQGRQIGSKKVLVGVLLSYISVREGEGEGWGDDTPKQKGSGNEKNTGLLAGDQHIRPLYWANNGIFTSSQSNLSQRKHF